VHKPYDIRKAVKLKASCRYLTRVAARADYYVMPLNKPTKLDLASDVIKQLSKAGIIDKFQQLPVSHQREYLKWIEAAKKPETRSHRINKMLNMLSNDKNR
jgi:uncharacterized protein YdeI (YjbR/CyaY-like superfamily)